MYAKLKSGSLADILQFTEGLILENLDQYHIKMDKVRGLAIFTLFKFCNCMHTVYSSEHSLPRFLFSS